MLKTVENPLRVAVDNLFRATNAFDVPAALQLFVSNAVVDDPSVGEIFTGHAEISAYVERFFLGYHTVTRILTVTPTDPGQAHVQVDFTGDFGHEIGRLVVSVNPDGLIVRIDADLE